MGLTSLNISSSGTTPTEAELTQFLNDGVIDVTNRWLLVRPQDIDKFTRESITTASNGFDTTGAQIIAVIREAGADGDTDGSTAWEPCRKVPVQMQSRVVDVDSLSYASKYNPVYIIDSNGLLNVYTVPDGTDDGYRVFYVNNSPEETDGSALDHASTGIKWFPNDKVYLVVLYASMRSVQAKMADTTITDLSVIAVPPDVPSLSSSSVSFSQAVPTYNKESITARVSFEDFWEAEEDSNPFGDNDPGELTITAIPPDVPTIGTSSVTISGTAPTYNNAIASSEFSDLATLIDTNEDVELATAKVQEINALIQNELNEFNQETIDFQARLQKDLKDADFDNEEDARKIQKYSAELQEYQAEVGTQVQEYTQNFQRYTTEMNIAYQAWAKTESDSMQKYQADIQQELNEFNKENAAYMAQLQISIKNADIDNQEDARKVQKYQAEYAGYAAEVNSEVQEYTQNLQADGGGYQWLQDQYNRLKAEYDTAFMLAAPKPQQQPVRR